MSQDVIAFLETEGLVTPGRASLHAFGGGVSSDVWRVDCPGRPSFVVKRSVPKLRVQADWFSDPARLRYEFLYLRTAADIVPGAVPRLLTGNPDSPCIAMEFLGDGYDNWKTLLLAGACRVSEAQRAGGILGRIHAATRANDTVRGLFDTIEFFTQLRIDAYLRTTAAKHPGPAADAIFREADRLATHAECLVHGDYSPKNMLTGHDRLVILDCETACFGDPAFDLAFLLNHLCLKALHHAPANPGLPDLASAALDAYRAADPANAPAVEARTARLLPMLLLARVDGKSPVEYLPPAKQSVVRDFALPAIPREPSSIEELLGSWFARLESIPPSP